MLNQTQKIRFPTLDSLKTKNKIPFKKTSYKIT